MTHATEQKLSFWALVALVVGSMVGSGIFTLPAAFARSSGAFGAGIAWLVAGIGTLALAFVFQSLTLRKPELDTGIFAYAKAGFGRYVGFNAALGYWIGCCLADVACLILIKATLGAFFPVFGDGTTIPALVGASVILWGTHVLILRGVKEAAALNSIVTAAKLVPLVIFIAVAAYAFDPAVFVANLRGGDAPTFADIFGQARGVMLVAVFAFVGIEGASVYSRLARDRRDVGAATVLGLIVVFILLVLVTMLSFGVLPQAELARLRNPSTAGIMEHVVGRAGAAFIGVSLIVSVLGNYLSWSLLAAEVVYAAARNDAMPAPLARVSDKGVPVAALWLSNGVIQLFLLVTYFAEYAFNLALKMTSAMTLVPYCLVAAYGVRLACTGETYDRAPRQRSFDLACAAVALIYAVAMILAGGAKYLLFVAIILAAGSLLYVLSKKPAHEPMFRPAELALFSLVMVAALIGISALVTGALTI